MPVKKMEHSPADESGLGSSGKEGRGVEKGELGRANPVATGRGMARMKSYSVWMTVSCFPVRRAPGRNCQAPHGG